MHIKKVINGLIKYVDREILPHMNETQQTGYAIACDALLNENTVVETLQNNFMLRAMVSLDKEGNVDTERLRSRLINSVKRKGSLVLEIPLYGKFTFTENDINEILDIIEEYAK